MRVIVRRERPHPGAQLRLTDRDGHRLTAFATNTAPGGPGRQLADLELRHSRRARAEDGIRCANLALADAIITVRSLIRRSWTTHRWETRPARRP